MRAFAELLDRLYFTSGNLAKTALLLDYLHNTPDPDRGWAVAAIAGELRFDLFKRSLVRDLISERTDPVLFAMSYDYVGETAETVAHLWPESEGTAERSELPPLSEVIAAFQTRGKTEIGAYLAELLDAGTAPQRWALIKLGTQGLRIGVSARFMKRVLAEFGGVALSDVEEVWHGQKPPYVELFDWLEGRAPKPDTSDQVVFHPVMLSSPLDNAEIGKLTPEAFQAEWKYDGIRVQLVSLPAGRGLFSRTGDDIAAAFPDLLQPVNFHAVLDGELLVLLGGKTGSFNDLQQRLNRKKPSQKLIAETPAHMVVYDVLRLGENDLRSNTLSERRAHLEHWFAETRPERMTLSPPLFFDSAESLIALRDAASIEGGPHVEGLMLKRKASPYIAGRPQGEWYKWKREARLIDAVLMYAQRGSGKRSSFYSDYTFGLWQGADLLPVGKAYSGFTDEELHELDRWVRNNTIDRFGPVREVEKELVFEVAFDSVHESKRHKSGVAMRFPRISRIRWDKPAPEADRLDSLKALI